MGAGPGLARSPREAGLSRQQVEQVEGGAGERSGGETPLGVGAYCTRRAPESFSKTEHSRFSCVVRFPLSPEDIPSHTVFLSKPQSCRFPTPQFLDNICH